MREDNNRRQTRRVRRSQAYQEAKVRITKTTTKKKEENKKEEKKKEKKKRKKNRKEIQK